MKLRKQLILVSLLTLSLPWAGCQYVREMEDALRQGQSRALLATAEAVSNRIASEPLLVAELTQNFASIAPAAQLYAHPIQRPILLDGYDEEWRHWQFAGKQWRTGDLQLDIQSAHHNKTIFLFIRVQDTELDYYHPGQAHFTRSDHLLLRTLDRDGRLRDFALVASAPGLISAYDIQAPHHELLLQDRDETFLFDQQHAPLVQRRQEHAIKGVWQERSGGYQVEVQLPWYLTQGYLGIAVINPVAGAEPQWLGSISPESPPPPLVKHSDELRATLAVFASDDLRLRIASSNQWLIAEAGELRSSAEVAPQNGFTAILRKMFTRKDFPVLDHPELNGRLDTDEITHALRGEEAAHWYSDDQGYREQTQILARAAAPIRINQQIVGAVVAEQTSASLLALTDTAFKRLVFYTLFATALAGLGLIAYASWLSLRIRRLSRAADNAISEDGKLEDAFIASQAQDEIGDLSRSYNQLLTRVQEYTDYLRTLSNKLSHELRTPLAVVRSSLDNLENENLEPQAKIYATRAQEGSQRLSAILTAISSASRVEESIRSAEMAHFPLDKVVGELTQAYRDIAPQKVTCAIEPNQEYLLFGSADLIVQMIDKLFDNACDFCPTEGEINIDLSRTKNTITLKVSNDGPLLPQKMQSQLFDSLVSIRDKNSHRDNKNDTIAADNKIHLGLGLHIVRLIVELHEARVSAHNRADGKGVEFVVSFDEPIGQLKR